MTSTDKSNNIKSPYEYLGIPTEAKKVSGEPEKASLETSPVDESSNSTGQSIPITIKLNKKTARKIKRLSIQLDIEFKSRRRAKTTKPDASGSMKRNSMEGEKSKKSKKPKTEEAPRMEAGTVGLQNAEKPLPLESDDLEKPKREFLAADEVWKYVFEETLPQPDPTNPFTVKQGHWKLRNN